MKSIFVPHRPPHKTFQTGTYMITSATNQKINHFREPEDLDFLQNSLLTLSEKWGWELQAWSIFPNHYHFIAKSINNSQNLSDFLSEFHLISAKYINEVQGALGRKVWYQFWDTYITHHSSYCSRLNYVMKNPVKHKIVSDEVEYRWCSANWFKTNSDPLFYKAISRFKCDQLNIGDDF